MIDHPDLLYKFPGAQLDAPLESYYGMMSLHVWFLFACIVMYYAVVVFVVFLNLWFDFDGDFAMSKQLLLSRVKK